MIDLTRDMHVHSTFSDGKGTLDENIQSAITAGIRHLGCVDHVRRDTDWLPFFTAAVAEAQQHYAGQIRLACGIEAKLLDVHGTLDMPDDIRGVDLGLAADHQLPLGDGYISPRAARDRIAQGTLRPEAVINSLVDTYASTMVRHAQLPLVLAHPFSILPKIRLDEGMITDAQLSRLARIAARTHTAIEIDERWRCPTLRTVRAFLEVGVTVYASTDSHQPQRIGQYSYVRELADQLCATTTESYAWTASA